MKDKKESRMKRLRMGGAVVAALSLVGLSGCVSGNSELGIDSGAAASGKQITIGYVNWDEDIAVTHLWDRILTDKGYSVTTKQVSDAGPMYVGLAKGDIDTYLAAWLPSTQATYWKKYGDQLTKLKTWYDKAPLTIAVPTYLKDVNSIADLQAHADDFGNTITGIEPGAGETGVVQKMMPKYGLSGWTLKTSSTAAMLAALKKATDAKQPIVVDLWKPHWAYATFPIKDLADPKGAMGKPDQIQAIGDGSFGSDFPYVTAMLKKFHMSDHQLSTLEQDVLVDHKDDPDEGVDAWLQDNPNFESSLG